MEPGKRAFDAWVAEYQFGQPEDFISWEDTPDWERELWAATERVIAEPLQAEIDRLRALTERRQIETAPKDGAEVLASWPSECPGPVIAWFADGRWLCDYTENEGFEEPDCWWPLPESPKGT